MTERLRISVQKKSQIGNIGKVWKKSSPEITTQKWLYVYASYGYFLREGHFMILLLRISGLSLANDCTFFRVVSCIPPWVTILGSSCIYPVLRARFLSGASLDHCFMLCQPLPAGISCWPDGTEPTVRTPIS